MTQTSAFHFESLVWDWPIAIYLFLIGISAGLVTLAVLLRRFYPQAGGADSTLLRTTLIVGPGAVILGLLILVFHLTRPWTFWKLMFHYSFYLGDVDGGDAVSALHGGAGAVAGENL
ncbi:cytochrome c-type biogenesis protein [Escherichia coli]|nr:cytochrome c-type biogenesis protein [Escherichia coli]